MEDNQVLSNQDIFERIEKYYKDCCYVELINEAKSLLLKWPSNPYLLRRLAFAYFKEDKIRLAGEKILTAWQLYPNDGLVIWDYAQYLWITNEELRAIRIMKRLARSSSDVLLRKTVSSLIPNNLDSIKMLINDSRFILGEWYYNREELKLSLIWLTEYVSNREKGLKSDFDLSKATGYIDTISAIQTIEKLWFEEKDDDDLANLKELLQREVCKNPDDSWFSFKLASLYLEIGEFALAMKSIVRAMEIKPNDSLYLWVYAQILEARGDFVQALDVSKRILKRKTEKVALVWESKSLWYAKALKNDCRYLMSLCYEQLGRKRLAAKWLQLHLDHRQKGLKSNYSKIEALTRLRQLNT